MTKNNLNEAYEMIVNGPDVVEIMLGRIAKMLDLIDGKLESIPVERLRITDYHESNLRNTYTSLKNFYDQLCDTQRSMEYEAKKQTVSSYTPEPTTYIQIDEGSLKALSKKASEHGIGVEILKEVYHREFIETEDAKKAFERVNSFLNDGRARKIDDADLWEAHEINQAATKFFEECDCEDEDEKVVEKKGDTSKLKKTIREAFGKNFKKKDDDKGSEKKDDDKKDGKKPPFGKKDKSDDDDDEKEVKDPSGKKDKVVVDPEENEVVGE